MKSLTTRHYVYLGALILLALAYAMQLSLGHFQVQSWTAGLVVLVGLCRLFRTPRLAGRVFGLVAALLFLPVISLAGFLGIALWPGLTLYVSFSVLRRVGEYALSKPAREVLFTVVSREEKYKAKNFIDTAVSRAGDASTGWLVSGIKALGVTTTHIAWILVPCMVLWAWLSHWLAVQQRQQVISGSAKTAQADEDRSVMKGTVFDSQKNRMV